MQSLQYELRLVYNVLNVEVYLRFFNEENTLKYTLQYTLQNLNTTILHIYGLWWVERQGSYKL